MDRGEKVDAKSLPHRYRMPDGEPEGFENAPEEQRTHRARIEPWLSAMFQSEHLSLLLGRGFPLGVGSACGAGSTSMPVLTFPAKFAEKIGACAGRSAKKMGRGSPNFENELRVASELLAGLSRPETSRRDGTREGHLIESPCFARRCCRGRTRYRPCARRDP